MSEFVSLSSSDDYWKPAEHIGRLLIIEVESFEHDVETSFELRDALRLSVVHDIDAEETSENVRIFTPSIVNALRPHVGSKVLVQLTKGVPKPGKSAPYVLIDMSQNPEEEARAMQYLDSWKARRNGFTPLGNSSRDVANAAAAAVNKATSRTSETSAASPDVQAALAALQAAGISIPTQ